MYDIETADVIAQREGRPVVLVTPHDLLSILEGRALSVGTLDRNSVAIRLYTPEEFLAGHVKSCEEYGIAPSMDIIKATELVKPIKLF